MTKTALERLEEALADHAKRLREQQAEQAKRKAEWQKKRDADLHARGINPRTGWSYATEKRWADAAKAKR